MQYALGALAMAVSYLCGCFNGAIVVSKYILRDDVRAHGSGNAGLTNFYRTFGGPVTFIVLLTDFFKVVVAILLTNLFLLPWGSPLAARFFSGFFVMLGHMYPAFFGFRGGKGVLAGAALALMIDWRIFAVLFGLFLVVVVLTRYVSLGSVCGGAAFPFATFFVLREMPHLWLYTALAAVCGGMLVFKHRENIGRLLRGEERKFHF